MGKDSKQRKYWSGRLRIATEQLVSDSKDQLPQEAKQLGEQPAATDLG